MADLPADDLKAKLVKLRREGEERAAERLAKEMNLPYVDVAKKPISLEAVRVIPEAKAREAKAAGIEVRSNKIALAAVNPALPAAKALVEWLTGQHFEVKVFVVSPSGLAAALRFYKFVKPEAKQITGKVSMGKEGIEALTARLVDFDSVRKEFAGMDFSKVSPVALMEVVLGGALALRASDIHTEAGEKSAKIRFRIDGLLHDIVDNVPLHAYEALVSRIKLLSEMKLNIRDEAQDGRFTIGLADKEIEMRVSVIPAEFGETIVMRILGSVRNARGASGPRPPCGQPCDRKKTA